MIRSSTSYRWLVGPNRVGSWKNFIPQSFPIRFGLIKARLDGDNSTKNVTCFIQIQKVPSELDQLRLAHSICQGRFEWMLLMMIQIFLLPSPQPPLFAFNWIKINFLIVASNSKKEMLCWYNSTGQRRNFSLCKLCQHIHVNVGYEADRQFS